MKEKLICIATASDRTYYKAVTVAKEFLDKEHNVINTTGTIPNGILEQYDVSSVSRKQLEDGKLHGTLQIINLADNTVTLSEQYNHGKLIPTVPTAEQTPAEQAPSKPSIPVVNGTIVKVNKNTLAFYVNGQEVAEQTFSAQTQSELLGNIPDGEVKELDEANKIKAVSHYKNNKLHGPFIRYDESGDMISREEYVNGLLEGPAEYVSYSKSGFLHTKCTYKNACLEGERIVLQKDGTLREREFYQNGLLSGTCCYYYPDGSLECKATFQDGKFQGERILYFPSGDIWYKENFEKGFLQGPRTTYFPNGKIYSEESYEKGTLCGARKVYAQDGTLLSSNAVSEKETGTKRKK